MSSDRTAPCRVCGTTTAHRAFRVREMMLGLPDEFDYTQCGSCGSLEIVEPPPDLQRFYPPTYDSFSHVARGGTALDQNLRTRLSVRWVLRPTFLGRGASYSLFKRWEQIPLDIEAVGRHRPPLASRILDVGSGDGELLHKLQILGYRNLLGIDPFLPADGQRGLVRLRKCRVQNLGPEELFDTIILYHSLEHAPDPFGTLRAVREHLVDGGTVMVATPIVNEAFRRYGPAWYQLDAPRHIHVFSVKGLETLLDRAGLTAFDRYFNSTSLQFRLSEQYSRGVSQAAARKLPRPSLVRSILSPAHAELRYRAAELNRLGLGDQAVFYLRKAPSPAPGPSDPSPAGM